MVLQAWNLSKLLIIFRTMKLLSVALHHLVLCEFLSFLVHSTPPVGLFFSPPEVSGTFLTLGLWNNLVSSASSFSLSCPLGLLELIIYFSAYSLFFLKAFLFHVRNNVVYHTLNFPCDNCYHINIITWSCDCLPYDTL